MPFCTRILCFFHDFSLKFMLFSCLCRWNWARHAMTKGHCLFQLEVWGRCKSPSGSREHPWWGSRGRSPQRVLGSCSFTATKTAINSTLTVHFPLSSPFINIKNFLRSPVFSRQIIGLVVLSALNFQWQVQKNQKYVTLFR